MKPCTAGSNVTRRELGAHRCFWSLRIHEALRRNGRSARTIAYELEISESAVSATILGKNHSARVLEALRSSGVPEKYLFDPRRIGAAGKEAA